MENFRQNAPVIMVVLAAVMLIMLVVVLIAVFKLVKNLVNRRFGFHEYKEVERESGRELFSVVVANRSLSDVAVSEIGIAVKGKKGLKYFDFQNNYRAENRISEESRPVISQRSSLKLSVSAEEAEALLFPNVDGKYKKTYVYVVDSAGNLSRARAKNLDKVLKADFAVALRDAAFRKAERLTAPTFGEKFALLFGRLSPDLLREESAATEARATAEEERPQPAETPEEEAPAEERAEKKAEEEVAAESPEGEIEAEEEEEK